MIKSHLFAAYASCTLLWCSMAAELVAQDSTQTGRQLTFRKMDIPIEGDYNDAVFYAGLDDEQPQPKIVLRDKSIDFLTLEGKLRQQINTPNTRFARIASNGKFIGVYNDGFCLYDETGQMVWKDVPYEDGYDSPGRLYRISSNGAVSTILREIGTIILRNSQGAIMGEHNIISDMSRTLDGRWSDDGQYFLAHAPIGQNEVLTLFGETGERVWDKRLTHKWATEVDISHSSRWIFIRYEDFSTHHFGAMILSTTDGTIVWDIDKEDLMQPEFALDENLLLIKSRFSKSLQGQRLLLLDLEKKSIRFETILKDRILDYKLLAADNLIYIVHRTKILALDLNADILNRLDLEPAVSLSIKDTIHSASSVNSMLLRTQQGIISFRVE